MRVNGIKIAVKMVRSNSGQNYGMLKKVTLFEKVVEHFFFNAEAILWNYAMGTTFTVSQV